ncbi:MAG: sulfurtransferase [Halofilum sp. (in: g-proteobacteria)]|nr:sulfurtransferase [Halofilum sp. (in: g-proteobacteria)]
MTHKTLIDTDTLRRHLGDPGWRVVDCRFDLADPGAGEAAWAQAHVPGAVYAHLERDLSGPTGPDTGRHPLPDPEDLADWLGAHGIGNDTQVVACDADSGAFAARLWWLLRWLGHDAVAVLDGGLAAWRAGGHPVDADAPAPAPAGFRPRPRDAAMRASAQELEDAHGPLVVDARSAERFRGEHEPIDPVAGHVPGARNRPFPSNLDAHGHWRSPQALRAEWARLLGTAELAGVVHMCGSGVTACHNALAMEHAGLRGSRLYAGSWSEWITAPGRGVATGSDD